MSVNSSARVNSGGHTGLRAIAKHMSFARLVRTRACRMRDSKKFIFILILSILRENDAKINNVNNFYIFQNI